MLDVARGAIAGLGVALFPPAPMNLQSVIPAQLLKHRGTVSTSSLTILLQSLTELFDVY
jgi:hypothetical protein